MAIATTMITLDRSVSINPRTLEVIEGKKHDIADSVFWRERCLKKKED
jgi:hypothetical protein